MRLARKRRSRKIRERYLKWILGGDGNSRIHGERGDIEG